MGYRPGFPFLDLPPSSIMCVFVYCISFISFPYCTYCKHSLSSCRPGRERVVVGSGRVIRHRPVARGVSQPAQPVHPVRIVQAGKKTADGYPPVSDQPPAETTFLPSFFPSCPKLGLGLVVFALLLHQEYYARVNHPECILARQPA